MLIFTVEEGLLAFGCFHLQFVISLERDWLVLSDSTQPNTSMPSTSITVNTRRGSHTSTNTHQLHNPHINLTEMLWRNIQWNSEHLTCCAWCSSAALLARWRILLSSNQTDRVVKIYKSVCMNRSETEHWTCLGCGFTWWTHITGIFLNDWLLRTHFYKSLVCG